MPSQTAKSSQVSASPLIEVHSIDYVPFAERSGHSSQLFTVTFAGQAMLATVATGVIGVAAGLPLGWALLAMMIGTVFGTLLVAAHSAQGPHLGLPQMIQSRPQFGFIGANLIWIVALINYIGYNVFNILLAGQALKQLAGIPLWAGYIVFTILAALLAVVGYRWIHRANQWISYVLILTLLVFTIGIFATVHLTGMPLSLGGVAGFKFSPFMIQISAAISYQISWAIYMSDYSRYLPKDVGSARPFWWTYLGVWGGGVWMMVVGALSASLFPKLDITSAIIATGDHVASGFGTFTVWAFLPGLVTISTMNMYGGSLTMLGIANCFKSFRSTTGKRVVTIGLGGVAALVLAFLANGNFITEFGTFLSVLLYLIAPWSAVNLVDFYWVRRGRYSVREIFNPRGLYQRWSWRGLAAYGIGFTIMIPFWSLSFYTGPVAHALGGGDISVLVGFPVAGITYYLFSRSLNLKEEWARVAEADAGLEPSEGEGQAGSAQVAQV